MTDELTPEQKRIARFWAGGQGTALPPGIWIRVVLHRMRGERVSTPRAARIFALLNIAMADAGVAAWDAKYKYSYWRPVTGIRLAADDGNPDTAADTAWAPLISTPAHPSYVSAHASVSGAAFGGSTTFWPSSSSASCS